jgi:hypothetical protein
MPINKEPKALPLHIRSLKVRICQNYRRVNIIWHAWTLFQYVLVGFKRRFGAHENNGFGGEMNYANYASINNKGDIDEKLLLTLIVLIVS